MKILKYKKSKNNEYKIITDKEEYVLYDDIIIKYELLLKKEIEDKEFDAIVKENNMLKAYYTGLKLISARLRTKKELSILLRKKEYSENDISYALEKLDKEGYFNNKVYIEAYIHDALGLYLKGEAKIKDELINLGFKESEIEAYLNNIDKNIYREKINKYVEKKLKSNKKSAIEFKRKITQDLINKGFYKEDIMLVLDNIKISDNKDEVKKLAQKIYNKYSKKYDLFTTEVKIKNYLYSKGYTNINIDELLEK